MIYHQFLIFIDLVLYPSWTKYNFLNNKMLTYFPLIYGFSVRTPLTLQEKNGFNRVYFYIIQS